MCWMINKQVSFSMIYLILTSLYLKLRFLVMYAITSCLKLLFYYLPSFHLFLSTGLTKRTSSIRNLRSVLISEDNNYDWEEERSMSII
jgi:hypothetical protein